MNIEKKTVLFLCTGNSARSQMAEALLKHRAGDRFDVYSAGTHPEKVDDRAIDALSRFGIDIQNVVSNHLTDFKQNFDYVITLCDRANHECRSYPGAGKQLAWDFTDPKMRADSNAFSATLTEINNRISMFILVEDELIPFTTGATTGSASEESANNPEFATSLEPVNSPERVNSLELTNNLEPKAFYKCLTDDIRLKTLMMTHYHGELCVCELMEALAEDSQPKVSRNLAVLKKSNIITDRKHGQWVFYRINPKLPMWAKCVIAQTTENNIPLIEQPLQRLAMMQCRPNKASFCK